MTDITIHNLRKKYANRLVLDIDHLEIPSGGLVGIVGNNGAGKTTLFRLVLDLIESSSGHVSINGENVKRSDHWKKHTGSFIDDGFLIDFLTPEEFFYFTARLYGLSREAVNDRLVHFYKFMHDEILDQGKYIRQFSTGNKQKIGIIAAMIVQPSLLILDEPFNFLDPSSQILIKRLLKIANEKWMTTILISSHNLSHITEICSRIILLENGKVIKDLQLPADDPSEIEGYFSVNAD